MTNYPLSTIQRPGSSGLTHRRTPSNGSSRTHPYPQGSRPPNSAVRSQTSSRDSTPQIALQSAQNDLTSLDSISRMSPAIWVDQLGVLLKLDDEGINDAHHFYHLPTDEKLVLLYMETRANQSVTQKSLASLAKLGPQLVKIEDLCRKSWEPSDPQEKLFKELVRHYAIKPVGSYKGLAENVKDYIAKNATKLRLQLYIKDALVKRTVSKLLVKEVSEQKSQLRKAVFQSVRNHISLEDFANQMVATWHMPKRPDPIPDTILATLALLREIAAPIARDKGTKGKDSGFWSEVETVLTAAYAENGSKRGEGPAWLSWQEQKILEDDERFSVNYNDPEEEFAPDDVNGAQYGFEEPEADDGNDDGDYHINDLDDLAAGTD